VQMRGTSLQRVRLLLLVRSSHLSVSSNNLRRFGCSSCLRVSLVFQVSQSDRNRDYEKKENRRSDFSLRQKSCEVHESHLK
jgi:hypothetical protein